MIDSLMNSDCKFLLSGIVCVMFFHNCHGCHAWFMCQEQLLESDPEISSDVNRWSHWPLKVASVCTGSGMSDLACEIVLDTLGEKCCAPAWAEVVFGLLGGACKSASFCFLVFFLGGFLVFLFPSGTCIS